MVELLEAAAAPAVVGRAAADDDQWGAAELGLGDRADPVGDPRAGGEHCEPGIRVSLPIASAAKTAVCSCRTSRSRIGGSAFTAPSYIGKTCAPGQREHRLDAVRRRATATRAAPL